MTPYEELCRLIVTDEIEKYGPSLAAARIYSAGWRSPEQVEDARRGIAEGIATAIEVLAVGQTFTTGGQYAIGVQDSATIARTYKKGTKP